MDLTVLGASPAPVNPAGAGSGYLVSHSGTPLLLECGPGVAGRLRARTSMERLAGVVISHLHQDHCIDLLSLRYGLRYGGWRTRPLPLFLPPGGRRFLSELGRVLDGNRSFFEREFGMEEYASGQAFSLGPFLVRPRWVKHYVPSHALVVSAGERRLTFSADAAPSPELVEAARDANLLLCEATLASAAEDAQDPAARGHMSGREAGETARAANVGQLLLTHFPAEEGRQRRLEARRAFRRSVRLAREGHTYPV